MRILDVDAIIYIARCKTNGKVYVGFTSQVLSKRMWQHKNDAYRTDRRSETRFHRAIRKYGFEDFEFSVLQTGELNHLKQVEEARFIREYQSTDDRFGYNISSGGEGKNGVTPWNKGIPRTAEVKKKLRLSATGRKQSLQTIEKRTLKTRGKKRTSDTKLKMSSTWSIIYPDGSSEEIQNLSDFCWKNGLTYTNMINVANGKRKHHKGYRCERLIDGPQSRRKTPPPHLGSDVLH